MRFLSRGPDYTVLFRDREADFFLAKRKYATEGESLSVVRPRPRKPGANSLIDVLHMRLIGVSPDTELSGQDQLPGVVNYFSGSDAAQWHTGIPTFAKVKYKNVYPGIDLVYYGSSSRLEFDFLVAAGASPSRIRLHFAGARRLELDPSGNLIVFASNGQIKFHKPLIYQLDSDNTKRIVEGRFRISTNGTLGFSLGVYDHTRPLVIDPILDYSTYLGTQSGATAIAVDSAGEAFVAGYTGPYMPTTTGSYQPSFPSAGKDDNTPVGGSDYINTAAFVAKFNSEGTALLYCSYLSGAENDAADAIAVDAAGDAYVAGQTASPDFPVTPGAFQTTNLAKGGAGFITALNTSGSGLIYSTFLSGSIATRINGLVLDSSNNVYVTGETADLDFPATPGAFQSTSPANPIMGGKGFVTKLAAGGQKLLYSTYLGGSKWDDPNGIAIDSTGNAYITGGTQSSDFPTTPSAFQLVNKATVFNLLGGSFVTKMNPTGTALVYSTYLDGSATDVANAIAVDKSGDAYITGFATSPDFPTTPGVVQPALDLSADELASEMSNVFITKLNAVGSGLIYSTFLGGNQSLNPGAYGDAGLSVAVDSDGNAYIAGSTEDVDFPVTPGSLQSQNITQLVSGDLASFVTKINPTASDILYSTYLTGSGDQSGDPAGASCDCATGIAIDSAQNIYVAGRTISTDFPTTLGALQNQSGFSPTSGVAVFVAKFDSSEMQELPLTKTTLTASPNPQMYGQPVTFTATVSGSSGSTPTGTVGFSYQGLLANGTPYAFGPWNNVAVNGAGVAEFTTSSLPSGWIGDIPGSLGVGAYYLGDANNSPSYGSMEETINQIPTTTTITANPSSAPYGTPITFTATVVETVSGKPAQGLVSFDISSTTFALSELNSAGQTTWTSGTLGKGEVIPVGAQSMTAKFSTQDGAGDQWSQGSVTVNITALGATAAPTFSPVAGTYSTTQSVTLNSATSGASIYYTTDGSTPTAGNGEYIAGFPIQVSTSETIQAIAVAQGDSTSPVASAAYVINLSAPSFTVSGTAVTVAPRTTGNTSTITVTPSGGWTGNVALTAVITSSPPGAVDPPTLSFGSTSPLSITGTSAKSAILTISTTAGTGTAIADPNRHGIPWLPAGGAALGFLLLSGKPTRRRRWQAVFNMALLMILAGGLLACGSGGSGGSGGGSANPGTTAGDYTITLSGTSGATTATGTIALTVQ